VKRSKIPRKERAEGLKKGAKVGKYLQGEGRSEGKDGRHTKGNLSLTPRPSLKKRHIEK
jgi:hypothetical protein